MPKNREGNMKRRNFIKSSTALGIGMASTGLARALSEVMKDPEVNSLMDAQGIDPYFLDPGTVTPKAQQMIMEFSRFHEDVAVGKRGIQPRGERPKGAPTYRFLHWDGDIGDSKGKFVGPLSLKPFIDQAPAYQMNAQLLAFNPGTEDWQGSSNQGALTIEMRVPGSADPLTWLFAEQFGVSAGGNTTLGLGYVAQKQGVSTPIYTTSPNVEIRMQLMQHKNPGLLQKIFKITSMVIGTGMGMLGQAAVPGLLSAIPSLRIPQLVPEGVAFTQALLGSTNPESPIWRSGFNSYGLALNGGRMRLRPGLWVVMDEQRQPDLRGIKLDDYGGKAALLLDGAPIESLNYLVLDVSLATLGAEQQMQFEQPQMQPEQPQMQPSENIIRGIPPAAKSPGK
jgi:hypothetical protein